MKGNDKIMGTIISNGIIYGSGSQTAKDLKYNNTSSGLNATNVQDAIDEVNNEKYVKPESGIPKTDLASAVQTSLGKADTALQNVADASINTKGIVKLTSDLSGTSETLAITQKAAHTINDTLSAYERLGYVSTNLWDEQWQVGIITADTGNYVGYNGDISSINFIKVKPNTTYYVASSCQVCFKFYDSAKKVIGANWGGSGQNSTFKTTSDTEYVRFRTIDYGGTYKHDIAIVEGTSGHYTPYLPPNTEITTLNNLLDVKMLGWSVPKECPIQNSVSGNVFTQKVGRVDLGSLSWSKQDSSTGIWRCPLLSDANIPINVGYSNDIEIYNSTSFSQTQENKLNIGHSGAIFYKNSNYSDASAVNSFMKGKYLYYELATPITMTIDGNEAVSKVNASLSDNEFLGWSVPSACPIQNYVDSNGDFHQKVGRVDLGSLTWNYDGAKDAYAYVASIPNAVLIENTDTQIRCFANGLNGVSASKVLGLGSQNLVALVRNSRVLVTSSYTSAQIANFVSSMKGKYLYYELATEVVIKNGNETVSAIKADLLTKGTYSKPSGGIPKTDLASAVQTSLSKADTAIQDISGKVDKTTEGMSTAINLLGQGTSDPTDSDFYIAQYAGGGTTTTTYHRRPHSSLWNYIKSKISSVLGLTVTSYGGSAAKVNNHTVNADVPSDAKFTDTDTKNTAGSADTSSKIFLVGATSQAANPQTYSDNQVYATNGQLDANKFRIAEKITLEYDSTNECLNFNFG